MSSILEPIINFEKDIFLLLNGSNSAFIDNIMWIISGKFIWLPIIVLLIFFFFYKTKKREAWLALIAIILVVTLCDQVSSGIIKPLFKNFRPTHHPDFKDIVDIVRGYRGGLYGFVSSHACNSFGLAMLISVLFKNRFLTITIFIWAAVNSYTRIYLGVHFITDVVCGASIGLLIGYIVSKAYTLIRAQLFSRKTAKKSPFLKQSPYLISYCIWITFLIIIIFNVPLTRLPH